MCILYREEPSTSIRVVLTSGNMAFVIDTGTGATLRQMSVRDGGRSVSCRSILCQTVAFWHGPCTKTFGMGSLSVMSTVSLIQRKVSSSSGARLHQELRNGQLLSEEYRVIHP